jgi:hypothetical protein
MGKGRGGVGRRYYPSSLNFVIRVSNVIIRLNREIMLCRAFPGGGMGRYKEVPYDFHSGNPLRFTLAYFPVWSRCTSILSD